MPGLIHSTLTKRERQIMDILYRRGRAPVGQVMEDLSGNPNCSTVRTQLRVLAEKGHVAHDEDGLRYIYTPAVPQGGQQVGAAASGRHVLRRLS